MEPENRIFLRHGDLIETPMRVISVVLGDGESVDGVWAEPIEGNPRAEDINLIPAYTERDIIELACRAPAVPEWFEPDMGGVMSDPGDKVTEWESAGQLDIPRCRSIRLRQPKNLKERELHTEESAVFYYEKRRQKIIQWPRAYAKKVLEAG